MSPLLKSAQPGSRPGVKRVSPGSAARRTPPAAWGRCVGRARPEQPPGQGPQAKTNRFAAGVSLRSGAAHQQRVGGRQHRRLPVVAAGTDEFGDQGLHRLAPSAHRSRARTGPPRRPRGSRPAGSAAAARHCRAIRSAATATDARASCHRDRARAAEKKNNTPSSWKIGRPDVRTGAPLRQRVQRHPGIDLVGAVGPAGHPRSPPTKRAWWGPGLEHQQHACPPPAAASPSTPRTRRRRRR